MQSWEFGTQQVRPHSCVGTLMEYTPGRGKTPASLNSYAVRTMSIAATQLAPKHFYHKGYKSSRRIIRNQASPAGCMERNKPQTPRLRGRIFPASRNARRQKNTDPPAHPDDVLARHHQAGKAWGSVLLAAIAATVPAAAFAGLAQQYFYPGGESPADVNSSSPLRPSWPLREAPKASSIP